MAKGMCKDMRRQDIHIRPATRSDHGAIDILTHAAFAPEDVVTFLNALRSEKALLGEWVAQVQGNIVGHISFTDARVEGPAARYPMPMLTPLSVDPIWQGQGIGASLVRHAHGQLRPAHSCVLGHPDYYPRFGYVHYAHRPIDCPWAQHSAFMIRGPRPMPGRLRISETVLTA